MEQVEQFKQIKQYIEFFVLIFLVSASGWATYQRNFTWKDEMSLWSDIVIKSPNKARGYNDLGLAYHNAKDLDNAIFYYKRGLSLNPYYADLYNNLGVSFFEKELVDEAIMHFKHAIKISPNHADAHYNLGIAYSAKGWNALAREEMLKGIELHNH